MGRLPNDGRGRMGGRQAGTKNKPKTYAGWAAKILADDRKQPQAMDAHISLLASLVISDALAKLTEVFAAFLGRESGASESSQEANDTLNAAGL
jgi:hypothetical protein